jgi:hypothetical protein
MRLRLTGKPQTAGLLERLDVERAQFVRTIEFDQHGNATRGSGGRDHARPFRQLHQVVGRDGDGAIAEHAIADHGDDRRDGECAGERRDQHDDARAGNDLRRRRLGGLAGD